MRKLTVYSKTRGLRKLKEDVSLSDYKVKHPDTFKVRIPSIATLEKWGSAGGCEAIDGCWVEPDGTCEHGYNSWLLELGYI